MIQIFNPKKIEIKNINGYLSIYQNEKEYIECIILKNLWKIIFWNFTALHANQRIFLKRYQSKFTCQLQK